MLIRTCYESNNVQENFRNPVLIAKVKNCIGLLIRTSFSSSTGQAIFKLMAVIVHVGTVDDGHYVTYRRFEMPQQGNEQGSKWLYTSDELVEVTSRDQALSSCAYMLFYERTTR